MCVCVCGTCVWIVVICFGCDVMCAEGVCCVICVMYTVFWTV